MVKTYTYGLILGLAILIVASVAGYQLQHKEVKYTDEEEKQYQLEVVDATPVSPGLLGERARIHSRLYTRYKQIRGGSTISAFVTQLEGKSKIIETMVHVPLLVGDDEPRTPEDYFGELSQESDAVIRGTVTSKVSQITEDEAFIFTDYDVLITEVLKNNLADPLGTGATVTVTRPGGKVLLDGIIVKATDQAFSPLPVNKNEVLLFLKFISETGTYQTARPYGSFEIDDSTIKPLTRAPFPPGVLQSGDSFLKTLR